MSDTPRTDAEAAAEGSRFGTTVLNDCVGADFARQLERELAEARVANARDGQYAIDKERDYIQRLKLIRRVTVALKRDTDPHESNKLLYQCDRPSLDALLKTVNQCTKEWEFDYEP